MSSEEDRPYEDQPLSGSESSEDGEQIDFSDDSAEESEAEFTDEEENVKAKSKKAAKKRKAKKPRFVEMEAEVGEDEEDEDEEEYDDIAREFIADEEELRDAMEGEKSDEEGGVAERYRSLAHRQGVEEVDAEAEERRLKELYGRINRRPKLTEQTALPSQFLLPAVTDPKLWLVRCKIGRERASVHQLLRTSIELEVTDTPLHIFSAVARDNLKGFIYVEAHKPQHIADAVERARITHWVFTGGATGAKVVLVPINEMPEVLSFTGVKRIAAGDLSMPELGGVVRIKKGKYAGDLAQVVEIPAEYDVDNLAATIVKIKAIPRLNYKDDAEGRGGKRKAAAASNNKDRPVAKLFDQHEASRYGSVTKSRGYWIFAGETYKDGYLYKDVRLGSLQTDTIDALTAELERLGVEGVEGQDASVKDTATSISFTKGDRVSIVSGDFKGLSGTVTGMADDQEGWVKVDVASKKLSEPISIRPSSLEKLFKLGDTVTVIMGPHAGEVGMVVDVERKNVTVYNTVTAKQVTVPRAMAQLSLAAQVTATAQKSKAQSFRASTMFALYDIVQSAASIGDFGIVTNILDDQDAIQYMDLNGKTVTESIDNLKKIVPPRRSDDSQRDLKAGERVLDSADPDRTQFVILAVHRGTGFLRKADGGGEVKPVPVSQLIPVRRNDLQSMEQRSPAPRFSAGGGALIGKSVSIAGGQHKGYIGIVKEVNDATARVELHTNSRIITVARERLVVIGTEAGPIRDARSAPFTPSVSVGKTPAWGVSAGKTPSWSAGAGSTGKTPAWNVSSGKTPAWSSTTPSWTAASSAAAAPQPSSSRTPAWQSRATSAKTPTWEPQPVAKSSKTPTWQTAVPSAATFAAPAEGPKAAALGSTWAIQDAEVIVGGVKHKIIAPRGASLIIAPIANQTDTRTIPLVDAIPSVPAKKDRVAIHTQLPVLYGSVIGLDGSDAVVKVDESGEFKIVNISNLIKMA